MKQLKKICFNVCGILTSEFQSGRMEIKPKIGCELEFRFIPPDEDYSLEHKRNVDAFIESVRKDPKLHKILQTPDDKYGIDTGLSMIGQISAEFRLNPFILDEYINEIEFFIEYIVEKCNEYHIIPIVIANHQHISITDINGLSNVMNNINDLNAIMVGILDAYHRLFPLTRLPTEKGVAQYNFGLKQNGYPDSAMTPSGYPCMFNPNPIRIETRLNNSEYMFDPWTTLFVILLGVYRGLLLSNNPELIDKDYPLDVGYLPLGKEFMYNCSPDNNYIFAIQHLVNDEIVGQFLSQGVVAMLRLIAGLYNDISKGKIGKEDAFKLVRKCKKALEKSNRKRRNT